MQLNSPPAETPHRLLAAQAVKAEMVRAGISKEQLAEAIGLSAVSVQAVLWGQEGSSKGRRRIEAFLRQPFWTPAAVFAERLPMIEFFGADIETMNPAELQALWRKVTSRRQVRRNKALLLALLRDEFTAAKAAPTATATPENQ
jgi:hypothetical protein